MFCRSCSPKAQRVGRKILRANAPPNSSRRSLGGTLVTARCACSTSRFLATSGVSQGKTRPSHIFQPALPAVAGYVHRQLKAAPNPELVEGAAQMILDHLLGRAHELANLAIGQTLPHQGSHLKFFRG